MSKYFKNLFKSKDLTSSSDYSISLVKSEESDDSISQIVKNENTTLHLAIQEYIKKSGSQNFDSFVIGPSIPPNNVIYVDSPSGGSWRGQWVRVQESSPTDLTETFTSGETYKFKSGGDEVSYKIFLTTPDSSLFNTYIADVRYIGSIKYVEDSVQYRANLYRKP